LTGGGIINAIVAGKLAGETAARCVKKGKWSEDDLAEYTRRWEELWGEEQRRYYRIKEVVHKLKDETLNTAAHILVSLPPEKRTMQQVFRTTLAHHPKILLDIARCFI